VKWTGQVRRLAATDLSAMRALNALFALAFADAASYAEHPPTDAYLSRFLGREHNVVLVGEAGGEVVGGLVAYELEKFEQARRELYIYDLAVAESHRRQGVATALIEASRAHAQSCGAWVIYVQADYGDDPAIALYAKHGRREDVMHFDIPVPHRATSNVLYRGETPAPTR
jgi:aminoglycoside 3-N-acetyltransferase I